jgi:tetratricopeptide (TPR) repeat protein
VTLPGLALASLLLAAEPAPAASEAHLVAGAEAFRAGSYDKALVEFRVAEALGSTEAARYAAASLLKLGRPEDAVEAFALADRGSRSGGDALLEVYRGEACYAIRLYLCADRWFESAASRAGPRLAPQLEALRSAIRGALQPDQLAPAIDRLLGRATELAGARPALAAAYADEAVTLAARSPARHREAEATSLATRLAAPGQKGRR